MATYSVTATAIYNLSLEIEADSEDEAMAMANDSLCNMEFVSSCIEHTSGDNDEWCCDFGEATIDYVERNEE